MGYVHAEIELTNYKDVMLNDDGFLAESKIRRLITRALVDSGAWDLVLNQDIQNRLNLRVVGKQTVSLVDESLLEADVVGPVEIRFEGRTLITTGIVLPTSSEVLLGAYPLEGLDAYIDPKRQKLLLNPNSPDNPTRYVKQVSLSI